MKVFASVYEYSKDKSSAMLNKKKTQMEAEKKGACWAKTFFTKFEETKNASYEYIEKIHKKIKNKSSSLFANFTFLKFEHDPKYNMYPWYTRLYLILKDQIKKIIKLTNNEDPVVPTEVSKIEKNKNKKKLSEDNICNGVDIDENDNNNVLSSNYSNDLIVHRNCKKLKRNNTENINVHDGVSRVEEEQAQDNALFSKRHASSIVSTLRSVRKNKSRDVEEEQFCDAKEITETVDINNKEESDIYTYDAFNKGDVATDKGKGENASNETENTSNIIEDQQAQNADVVKKFNIKNTWAKFSNIIS